jgi:hypothetical protein
MFSIFIGRHFECWKRYILLAYRRRNNFCSSLTLIYVTRWYSEGRPRKIRNLKYGGEIIKNKEGSETAELLSTDAGWLLLGTFDVARNKPETKWDLLLREPLRILILRTTVTAKIKCIIIFGFTVVLYLTYYN